jgi:hypothetical protein
LNAAHKQPKVENSDAARQRIGGGPHGRIVMRPAAARHIPHWYRQGGNLYLMPKARTGIQSQSATCDFDGCSEKVGWYTDRGGRGIKQETKIAG